MTSVNTTINKPLAEVWKAFTSANHIKEWNAANADWHTTHVDQNFVKGGSFSYRMEAKDGSMGFDYSGTYDEIAEGKTIDYTLDDGRKVKISFTEKDGSTVVEESFEPEASNSEEIQRQGWQAILDNFKKHVEGCDAHKKDITY